MRTITHSAEEVRALRQALGITQAELARRLEVSRRTVIRGERRGLEVPLFSVSEDRHDIAARWAALQQLAGARLPAMYRHREHDRRQRRTVASPRARRAIAKVSRRGRR